MVKYTRRRIELTMSVMYVRVTSKSVGVDPPANTYIAGLWTTLRCYIRDVPRRDIDLYEARVNVPPCGTSRPSWNIFQNHVSPPERASPGKVTLQSKEAKGKKEEKPTTPLRLLSSTTVILFRKG